MIIKKFQGKNEEEATALARKELGEAVVIMNVKTVRQKGLFSFLKSPLTEVTAAVDEPGTKPATPKTGSVTEALEEAGVRIDDDRGVSLTLSSRPAASAPAFRREEKPATDASGKTEVPALNRNIEEKLESLHSLIEEKFSSSESSDAPAFSEQAPAPGNAGEIVKFLKLIYNTLVDNEVDEKYANELLGEIEKLNRPGMSVDTLLGNIYQKMVLQFGKAEMITPAKEGPKVIFFIGPTGVGKTTTIAKIASSLSVREHKKISLVTTDTYRIAAAEQLKTYANILNVPFRVVYTVEEMQEAYDADKELDYIFVDTTGHSPKNEGLIESTKQILHALDAKGAETENYLVLSATTKYRDLVHIADIYKEMADFKLIFSKLDETETVGCLWNLKQYTGAAMSYITCGQNVPDDIAPFNPQTTVKQLLGGRIG